ncbi:MAG: acylphosphatase, partial [Hydrogenophaga sp.]|nr:acylphosphatase [Hydrogenophaga sp.]
MSAAPATAVLTDRPHAAPMCGARLQVRGIVQGVGFRPQVLHLARALGVVGSVHNEGTMAIVEAFGPGPALAEFEQRLRTLDHGGARIDALLAQPLAVPAALPSTFSIADSALAQPGLGVAPDWAICPACCAETLDPFARRYRYAFTACTACGPRLSVFERAPYDRARTT